MTKKKFIRKNQKGIDAHIKKANPGTDGRRLNDRERELWVSNDEALYNWARSEGVKSP